MLAAAFSAVSAGAVTFDEIDGPAEFPPASFGGSQYVDSSGCVFMRAGYAGQTTWVPRVARDRTVICGQRPTFGSAPTAPVIAAAPAPRVAPAGRVGRPMDTIATTTAPPRITAPATVRTGGPDPRSYAGARVMAAQAPAPVRAPAPVAQPRGVAIAAAPVGQTACPNRSPVAQRFMLADGRHVIRCVPQSEYPKTYATAAQIAAMPQGFVQAVPVTVPPGYKPAWKDDRLNPMRGVGTPTGDAQMAQVWTDKVPMKAAPQQVRVVQAPAPVQVTVSSRSEPVAQVRAAPIRAAAVQPAATSGRYVQVGTFGEPANAAATAARLRATGLPVATSKIQKSGRALQIVMLGPLAPADVAGALSAARRAGFADAYVR
ncbi:SPOR domain-containing protein [Frigidibacter sp.]|uniref:SPOR domain-containing protein n=1 Tax=Frigidibacter sp. TaxID=2586418 RepID=UPI00273464C8|nr:SPOR domain-containing protein [Frigidibacter sp.]MDP3338710.1 SPOR domain-containing protein [Frigidibacter sp.]